MRCYFSTKTVIKTIMCSNIYKTHQNPLSSLICNFVLLTSFFYWTISKDLWELQTDCLDLWQSTVRSAEWRRSVFVFCVKEISKENSCCKWDELPLWKHLHFHNCLCFTHLYTFNHLLIHTTWVVLLNIWIPVYV